MTLQPLWRKQIQANNVRKQRWIFKTKKSKEFKDHLDFFFCDFDLKTDYHRYLHINPSGKVRQR